MPTHFDELLDRFHAYLGGVDDALVQDAIARIAWTMPARPLQPHRLPCLDQLDRIAELGPPDAQPLVRLLAEHRGDLHWGQTYGAGDFGEAFLQKYGWLELFGTRGHFVNDEVAAGLLILGPGITYPDHHHIAEEIYIPITGGTEWRMGEGDFHVRRAGEVIHHASNVSHAMRTGGEPLLALYIWRGGPLAQKSTIPGAQSRGWTMAKAIMLQGTGSDVGKTVLVAGLCRAARNRGLRVRPFKPQNMSNNAAVADIPGESGGGEIGRGQWLQALACGVTPTVHMNPVLLKPQTDVGAQVVVQGKVFGEAKARDYQTMKGRLMDAVLDSWGKVREGADLVIVEGAGSPAEINLRSRDIANMGFATRADVPVVLVGDIDRGGVIASVAGTHLILPEEDRAMIVGYLINKFRGDVSLFDDGIRAIEKFTGWRCFGVVPWLKAAARLPSEDSVVLERLASGEKRALKVAVPMLGRIANFDDLDPLKAEPQVEVVFVPPGKPLPGDAGLVVIPGSKSTIGDLLKFRENGWDRDLLAHRKRGGHVVGICGGFQMLGRMVRDPDGIEGSVTEAQGLGLLDVETVMEAEKTVRNSRARSVSFDLPLEGYEIHLGRTTGPDTARPSVTINGRDDGAISADGKVFGTYLHGLFAADAFRAAYLASLGVKGGGIDYRAEVEKALDEIAAELETHLDCDAIFGLAR